MTKQNNTTYINTKNIVLAEKNDDGFFLTLVDGSRIEADSIETEKLTQIGSNLYINNFNIQLVEKINNKYYVKTNLGVEIQITSDLYDTLSEYEQESSIIIEDGSITEAKLSQDVQKKLFNGSFITIEASGTATSGTFSETELAKVTSDKRNILILNDELYTLQDDKRDSGYLVYSHVGQDNSNFYTKCITITLSTGGWVLTSQQIGGGVQEPIKVNLELTYNMEENNISGNTGYLTDEQVAQIKSINKVTLNLSGALEGEFTIPFDFIQNTGNPDIKNYIHLVGGIIPMSGSYAKMNGTIVMMYEDFEEINKWTIIALIYPSTE